MPLLKRQPFRKVSELERHKDSDEVFLCEQTMEIFGNYDDYYNRLMLLSSTSWSCAMTGRTNLTYADALECEKAARRTLKKFPNTLKGPLLLVASHTKRTAIHDLAVDVHGYVKNVFFEGEMVYTKTGQSETIRRAKVVRVAPDAPSNVSNATRLTYHLESSEEKNPGVYESRGTAVFRERNILSREKCKLFLKQHVELGPDQMLCIKKKSFERLVTARGWTDDKVFYGQVPDFGMSKRLQAREEEKKNTPNAATKAKVVKTVEKISNDTAKVKNSGSKKQQSISKYLEKTQEESVEAMAKSAAREKERLEKRAELVALAKKQREAEKALLLQQVTIALKHCSTIGEDQELMDQRVMPPVRSVRSLIGNEHFSNFLFILEFMNVFGDLLSIENKFPHGFTIDLLERALLLREVNGPLSDIFQVLLSTIFTQQAAEEDDETDTDDVAEWCERHFSCKLYELPMDATTVSELLRLHFLSSEQTTNTGDPCTRLIRDSPHIFRTLTLNAVYQLPLGTIIQLISALIHQLLANGEVLNRAEKAREDRARYKANRLELRRLDLKSVSLKHIAMENGMKELITFAGQTPETEMAECRAKLDQNLEKEYARIDADARQRMKQLQAELKQLEETGCYYQEYLGVDRGYRTYWQFQSLPGLFVEHDRVFAGRCMDRATRNIPALANCESKLRKRFITASIMKCTGKNGPLSVNEANELDAVERYQQLMIRGSALLEKDSSKRKDPFSLAKDRASISSPAVEVEKVEDPTVSSDPSETTAVPVNVAHASPPTNDELFMCTGVPENCAVHTPSHSGTVNWGYYATAEELDALINSLNQRGTREKQLRQMLEWDRDLIIEHMQKCPVEKLSIQESDRPSLLSSIVNRSGRTYQDANFFHEAGTDPNEILDVAFRENLLELESKIAVGCLGEMKVKDPVRWREAIERRSYDSQIDQELRWGTQRLEMVDEMYKHVKDRTTDAERATNDKPRSPDADMSVLNDPGHNLSVAVAGDTSIVDSQGLPLSLDHFDTQREKIRSLAYALLQIEQCVEPRFLRHPFGPKGNVKDKNALMQFQYEGQKKLLLWETTLMRSTSFSQLFLHYHILYDSIQWSRSVERSRCIVCRRKGDPEQTLLCDDCNGACHMYCLKPQLKRVPEGDWFCTRCRPDTNKPKNPTPAKNRKKVIESEDEEEMIEDDDMVQPEQEDEDDEQVSSEDDEDQEESEDEVIVDERARRRSKRTQDVVQLPVAKRVRVSANFKPEKQTRDSSNNMESPPRRQTRTSAGRRHSNLANGSPEWQPRRSRRTGEK